MIPADVLEGRVEEVAEGRDAGGRPRLFFARSPAFDARALYGAPCADVEHLARDWGVAVRRRLGLARDLGARLCMLLAPDAHAVHPEELPDGFAFAAPSLADRFVELFGAEPGLNLVHPREALRAARGPVDLYGRTDSHWTSPGAYAAYRMVMQRIGQGARLVGADDVRFAWREETGDLGWSFDPPRRAPTPRAGLVAPRARLTTERIDERRRVLRVYEVDDASLPTCLFLRDSFGREMEPFMAESFHRTVVVGADDRFFPEMLHELRPDVVVLERAERALPFAMVDWGPLTWREQWPDPGADAQAHAADAEARRRLALGDAAGAVEHATAGVVAETTPDRVLTLGRARLLAQDPAGAADAFSAAHGAEPARWAFALHLGKALLALGRAAEARDLFGRCCAVAPWHPLGFEHFGYASLELGDRAAAEPALRTAVRLGPELAGGYVWLARLLREAGDPAQALAVARLGLATCPDDAALRAAAEA